MLLDTVRYLWKLGAFFQLLEIPTLNEKCYLHRQVLINVSSKSTSSRNVDKSGGGGDIIGYLEEAIVSSFSPLISILTHGHIFKPVFSKKKKKHISAEKFHLGIFFWKIISSFLLENDINSPVDSFFSCLLFSHYRNLISRIWQRWKFSSRKISFKSQAGEKNKRK